MNFENTEMSQEDKKLLLMALLMYLGFIKREVEDNTDEEKEKLWINKLNKQERYINGTKISVKNGEELYYKVLKSATRN